MSQKLSHAEIDFYLLKAARETIQIGLMITGTETGRIHYVNSKLCEIFDYPVAALLEMKFSGLLYEGEDPDLWKHDISNNVIKFKSRKGALIWGLMSSRRIQDEPKGNEVGILYSISDITPRKIAENQLAQSQKKLRHLTKKLIDAQEAERKRIAVELHDGIGSNINAVRLMLERKVAKSGIRDQELAGIVDMLKNVSNDTRRISRNLHPSVLEDIGLVAAFQSIIREFNYLKPDILFRHQISIDEDRIDGSAKLTLYRILQEALNNIIRHSGADTVDITCGFNNGCVELEISDNGSGFDVDDVLYFEDTNIAGLGMLNMKERTEFCQGTFDVSSEINNGTRLCVSIPI